MSKLYNIYVDLKKQNLQTIYLFKSGIFFIALDEDAKKLSNLFNFKLTNFTPTVVKCGFPCSSFEKYKKKFQEYNLELRIVEYDKNISYKIKQYNQNQFIKELLDYINSIDINSLSIKEAYTIIEELQKKSKEIM